MKSAFIIFSRIERLQNTSNSLAPTMAKLTGIDILFGLEVSFLFSILVDKLKTALPVDFFLVVSVEIATYQLWAIDLPPKVMPAFKLVFRQSSCQSLCLLARVT
ncbi:hypothetical protein ACFL7M_19020 [Thermodesulfobacteriota bacterium]